MVNQSDTIAAISTAPGAAGISIIRISGPNSLPVADRLFHGGGRLPSSLDTGSFMHGTIRESTDRSLDMDLDEVILLVYHAPHSYTREDVVEIQGHGGATTARRILQRVLDEGVRLADPGEFTCRAFLNGRIDLLQAEAVCDIITARTSRAAAAAMEQLNGRLSAWCTNIYDSLLNMASDLEASLDFPEEDIPAQIIEGVVERLDGARKDIVSMLDTWEEGLLLREGATVVISGKPNVGKSTLLNTLLGKDRAIVSEAPGTTRDTIEESLVVAGVPVRLIDTAGLRDVDCHIEAEGVARARTSIAGADFVLYLVDGSMPLSSDDKSHIEQIGSDRCLVLLNKSDLGSRIIADEFPGFRVISCSLLSEVSLPEILAAIGSQISDHISGPPHAVISQRHRQVLRAALACIDTSLQQLRSGRDDASALAASDLRSSLELLGTITGRSYDSDLLDSIFSRFCIGK